MPEIMEPAAGEQAVTQLHPALQIDRQWLGQREHRARTPAPHASDNGHLTDRLAVTIERPGPDRFSMPLADDDGLRALLGISDEMATQPDSACDDLHMRCALSAAVTQSPHTLRRVLADHPWITLDGTETLITLAALTTIYAPDSLKIIVEGALSASQNPQTPAGPNHRPPDAAAGPSPCPRPSRPAFFRDASPEPVPADPLLQGDQ
ncbi:hypothetical protein FRACA_2510002 [Frankia canadensis]|uniref:Uncharacterized protein n=1 Tax=Frankia canadensis TaxID=1836972 RepID=A0A2I2KS50_9ACTN|nr:hypothetical protein [Frankia canadensis]SNQ48482.1 hypothetical protein FRACA_2510002 [Frankia canadensis]SOU55772.1 hypothetical protein FRACA_2510002 [Frankia canadensis]